MGLEQIPDILIQAFSDLADDVQGGVYFAVLDVGEIGVIHAYHFGEFSQRDSLTLAQNADVAP